MRRSLGNAGTGAEDDATKTSVDWFLELWIGRSGVRSRVAVGEELSILE